MRDLSTQLGSDVAASELADLRQQVAELQQAVRARDDFLAIAAHELRNPMTPILAVAELALKAALAGTVLLPEPAADQVAKGKGTDWNDYEASHGRAATRAALRTAGLQELAAQDARMAARSRATERQGAGLSA